MNHAFGLPRKKGQPSAAEPPPENHNNPKTPMGKFRDLVMKMAVNCTPNKSLSPTQKNFVNQKLQECFPDSKPFPDHPPYSWMILNAIWNLNGKGGSSEEAISKYIVKEHCNLPWAHATLLSHHLGKLCQNNEIFETIDCCYALVANTSHANSPDQCISSKQISSKKRKKSKSKQKKDSKQKKGRLNAENGGIEEQKPLPDERIDAIEEQDLLSEEFNEEEQPNSEQGQQKGSRFGRLPKKKIMMKFLQDINLESDRFNNSAKKEPNEQMQQDFVSEKCTGEEEALEKGKRTSIRLHKKNRKNCVVLEEQTDTEVHVLPQVLDEEPNRQTQQDFMSVKCKEKQLKRKRSVRLLKRNRKNNDVLEQQIDSEDDVVQPGLEDDDLEKPIAQMQQDFVSEKCRGKQLNWKQELGEGKVRSGKSPKRNKKNNVSLEEQTDSEVHFLPLGLEYNSPKEPNDFASEECNKEKGKRKRGKPHNKVVEELTNLESDFLPQGPDEAQKKNGELKQDSPSKEFKEAEEQQPNTEKGQTKVKKRLGRPKSKSSEDQKSHQKRESKQIEHQGSASAKSLEIQRSTRISIATSKKQEFKSAS